VVVENNALKNEETSTKGKERKDSAVQTVRHFIKYEIRFASAAASTRTTKDIKDEDEDENVHTYKACCG